jgi:hypothetical protein
MCLRLERSYIVVRDIDFLHHLECSLRVCDRDASKSKNMRQPKTASVTPTIIFIFPRAQVHCCPPRPDPLTQGLTLAAAGPERAQTAH